MMRLALILKADDLGGPINADAARFIDLTDAFGAIVSLGIITSSLTDRAPVNRTYADLHGLGFEAWFHGHTHDWSAPTAEFSGVGVNEQKESFAAGIELGREKLGVGFHSFGAPGNNIDDNTASAIIGFSQIKVWLIGLSEAPPLQGTDVLVLPRRMEFEEAVGDVRSPDEFAKDLDRMIASNLLPEVVTLQVHPNAFGEEDYDRCHAIFSSLAAADVFRFSSPFEEWKWRTHRDNLVLTKVEEAAYVLDLEAIDLDHWISFDPSGPLPSAVERLSE